MKIAPDLIEEILAHAREESPNECCGMIGGADGQARTVYRATNAEASPLRYSIDAKEQFDLMRKIEDTGEELVGIYHSHTHSEAYPSKTDRRLAFYPDSRYLLLSVADREQPVLRSFFIRDGEVTPEPGP